MASVNSLQSIQAWQETRSSTFFSTVLLILFWFPKYVFYLAENFQNGNY